MSNYVQRRQFAVVATIFELLFCGLFACFARFDTEIEHELYANGRRVFVNTDFPLFQDVHVMVFVGFGFLMAFLKRYGFNAVSVNMLLAAFVAQWAMLLRGFFSKTFHDTGEFSVSVNEMVASDISCLVVLITMGVVLGRLTPVQFMLLAFVETTISVIVNDGGRCFVVHIFGAYFGLAAAYVGKKQNVMEMDAQGSIYHSDLFSIIGTMFLWIFFPTLNAAIQEPADARHRAIVNTYLSMASCTVFTFIASSWTDRLGRFDMIHIQSSTLSGGVAIASSANAIVYPYHSIVVGCVASIISVCGHAYLSEKFNLYDTCGVHNLHGLPGLLSGFVSILVALLYADEQVYGKEELYHIYPYFAGGPMGGQRDRYSQAQFQFMGMIVAILAAILGGLITGGFDFSGVEPGTGRILRASLWNQIDDPDFQNHELNYYGRASTYMERKRELQAAAVRMSLIEQIGNVQVY